MSEVEREVVEAVGPEQGGINETRKLALEVEAPKPRARRAETRKLEPESGNRPGH